MGPVKLLVFLALLSVSTATRTISKSSSLTHASSEFNYVCNAEKFASYGLEMSMYAFCNKSLPYNVRVRDLVDSMTVEEKVQQLGNEAKGVPRLGLPPYQWWSEALHGVSNVGPGTFFNKTIPGATSFPTVILSAASFNESLWKSLGQAVSTEARAMYNLGMAGLTFWSPNINVVRDPRWGRALETPGEDPFVVGRYAVNYVRGLQDVEGHENARDLNSRPLKVSACCKHYAAYDVDNWLGVDRYHFDARVTEQDMVETFLRPFEMCVKEGDVSSVMCSYNRVNGIPTCADPKLLSDTIRGDWNLHGYIVSDCDSIEVLVDGHKWLGDSKEDAVAHVLKAGLDLDCGDYYPNFTMPAVNMGKVRESDIDKALFYLYNVLMRLGFFDGSPAYAALGKDDVCTKENIELATDAARQGIVLLKNDNNTLPLRSKKARTLAVVGPHANATSAMIGNYAGIPCKVVSPLDAFSKEAKVKYAMGCGDVQCPNDTFIFKAMEAAKHADATIIFAGLDLSVEAESLDRTDLLLPGYQTQLINQIADIATSPVILVIMSAGGVDISFAKHNPKIDGIIWAGYPGEQGGAAIADVIFGRYNPGGKLPLTWYTADYVDKLPMTSLQLRPDDEMGYPGRTYKFYNGSTVYPFGYGLSYTQFNMALVRGPRSVKVKLSSNQHCRSLPTKPNGYLNPCPSVLVDELSKNTNKETIDFEVLVENVGGRDGSLVLIVYAEPPQQFEGFPFKQAVDFERVALKAGESKTVKFELVVAKSLSVVTDTAYVALPSGGHMIHIHGDGAVTFPVNVEFHY
ncbi:hypothetical protein AAC387_Pa10g2135 [Persea americana]